jgi:hypothetical protein
MSPFFLRQTCVKFGTWLGQSHSLPLRVCSKSLQTEAIILDRLGEERGVEGEDFSHEEVCSLKLSTRLEKVIYLKEL